MTAISSLNSSNLSVTSPANSFVGSGDTSARWLGGLAGAGVGIGAGAVITNLASRSPARSVRAVGLGASLGSVIAGSFIGQHLLGQATRPPLAQVERETRAVQTDLEFEIRQLRAKTSGTLNATQLKRVTSLREERKELAISRPETGPIGKFMLPASLAAVGAVGAGLVAHRLSPKDTMGINAISTLNTIFAGAAGLSIGAWSGYEIGKIVDQSPNVDTLPDKTKQRISEIDQELVSILSSKTD